MSAKCSRIARYGFWGATVCLAGLLVAGPAVAQGSKAPPAGGPAVLYEKSCYSCHNIGGGDKKGPDLMGLLQRRDRAWLQRFIASPRTVKNSGDATAVKLFNQFAPEEMDDILLPPDQIDGLLELIDDYSKRKKTFVPTSGRLARKPKPEDIPVGRRLFIGQDKLQKGGAPCIACHSVTGVGALDGGRLGPDLTQANLRYTDVELASMLKSPAFPVMSKLFGNRQLTDEEVVKLFAYMQSTKAETPDPDRAVSQFMAWSALGMVAAFALMSLTWRGRLRNGAK
jgi:mono/diheme cytochrome c family protein